MIKLQKVEHVLQCQFDDKDRFVIDRFAEFSKALQFVRNLAELNAQSHCYSHYLDYYIITILPTGENILSYHARLYKI